MVSKMLICWREILLFSTGNSCVIFSCNLGHFNIENLKKIIKKRPIVVIVFACYHFGKVQRVMFWLRVVFTFGALKTPRLIYPKILFHRITKETYIIPAVIVLIAKRMYQIRLFARELSQI